MKKTNGFKEFFLTIGVVVSLVLGFAFTVSVAKNAAIIEMEQEMYKRYVDGGGTLSFDEWSSVFKYNQIVEKIEGKPGENGNTLLYGENDPTFADGSNGDLYINVKTNDLFTKENGVWSKKGNINTIPSISGDMTDVLNRYYSKFGSSQALDSYAFFTDPHLGLSDGTIDENFNNYFNTLKKYYDVTPTSFVVGGGDWINSGNTPEQAKFLLGYFSGAMNSIFNYVPILGNHDTNYQGTQQLSEETINNIMFYKQGSSHYSFSTNSCGYYVFDSGLDWYQEMNSSRIEQLEWFADSLMNETHEHIVIMLHVYYYIKDGVATFSKRLGDVIKSYNGKQSFTIQEKPEKTYDYSSATGRIEYALTGHSHRDHDTVLIDSFDNPIGVPVVGTKKFVVDGLLSFDLVVSDFENRKLSMVRVGRGNDRTIMF